MIKWWIGCSGFYYKHWKGTFYPTDLPQRRWFEFYCQHFNTVELNGTFYRFPRLAYLQEWYDRSPEEFCFAVKAPRWITHFNQFRHSEQMIADFYGLAGEGLGNKLGCILFQLPPRMDFSEEKLHRILDSLDPSFQNVLEFRHESWWNSEVYGALSAKNVIFSGMSHPLLPQDVIQNGSTLYYRFHGIPELYRSPYTKAQLKEFAAQVMAGRTVENAYIYFNNDIDMAAIADAKEMQALTAT